MTQEPYTIDISDIVSTAVNEEKERQAKLQRILVIDESIKELEFEKRELESQTSFFNSPEWQFTLIQKAQIIIDAVNADAIEKEQP